MANIAERFVFDIFTPLADQLALRFQNARRGKLTEEFLNQLPDVPGVYGLYLKGTLVYVGKTDEALRERLLQHFRKLDRRQNLNLSDVTFCALEMSPDLAPAVSEKILLRRPGFEAEWNKSGFGSKATGDKRFNQEPSDFNKAYPIRHTWRCESVEARTYSVFELLKLMKADLNKDGLFWPKGTAQGLQAPATDGTVEAIANSTVEITQPRQGAWSILQALQSRFPNWRAVKLHGWLLFWPRYKKKNTGAIEENEFTYELP